MNSQALLIPKINLKERKYLASRIACAIFILLSVLYQLDAQKIFDPNILGVVGIVFFSLQFIFQFQILNLFLGVILFFGSIYFSLAVFSEYTDFIVPNRDAYSLLFIGWSLCLLGIICSLLMTWDLIKEELNS